MTTLDETLIETLYGFMMVFVRLGAAFSMMPAFGDVYVSTRVRLTFALAISAVTVPLLTKYLPPAPPNPGELATLIIIELLIGLFYGLIVRVIVSALDIAAMVVAQQTSLSSATSFNPAMGTQGAVLSTFIVTVGLLLVFVTDAHHLLLRGMFATYETFPPGQPPMVGDMAEVFTAFVSKSFEIGLQLAAPFILIGIVFVLGLGLTARMMPQLQIFFVAQPIQIMIGLLMLAQVLPIIYRIWLNWLSDSIGMFLP